MHGALGVDATEVILVETLRHTGSVNHVVELVAAQLLYQLLPRREVQLNQPDTLVLQILPGTGLANGSPRLKASAKGLLNDKGADKAACTCDQYLHVAF